MGLPKPSIRKMHRHVQLKLHELLIQIYTPEEKGKRREQTIRKRKRDRKWKQQKMREGKKRSNNSNFLSSSFLPSSPFISYQLPTGEKGNCVVYATSPFPYSFISFSSPPFVRVSSTQFPSFSSDPNSKCCNGEIGSATVLFLREQK